MQQESTLLEKEIGDKKKEFLTLSEKLPGDGQVKIRTQGKEVKTEVIQRIIGKSEVIEKETENLIVNLACFLIL